MLSHVTYLNFKFKKNVPWNKPEETCILFVLTMRYHEKKMPESTEVH